MILIVDDDAGIRSSLKFILTHSGKYEVLTASNGEEAIEIVRKNSLRLVITDMNFSSAFSRGTVAAPRQSGGYRQHHQLRPAAAPMQTRRER